MFIVNFVDFVLGEYFWWKKLHEAALNCHFSYTGNENENFRFLLHAYEPTNFKG